MKLHFIGKDDGSSNEEFQEDKKFREKMHGEFVYNGIEKNLLPYGESPLTVTTWGNFQMRN